MIRVVINLLMSGKSFPLLEKMTKYVLNETLFV